MLAEIIASIVLLFSFTGIVVLVGKKVPVLLTFPAKEEGTSPRDLAKKLRDHLQSSKKLQHVASPDILLQKLLSRTRIAAMRTEAKTAHVLEKLRKKSQEKNGNSKFSNDKYWKELRRKH